MVKEGQAVKVKLLGFDDRGKVRLSMKQVDQTTGEDLTKKRIADAFVNIGRHGRGTKRRRKTIRQDYG